MIWQIDLSVLSLVVLCAIATIIILAPSYYLDVPLWVPAVDTATTTVAAVAAVETVA